MITSFDQIRLKRLMPKFDFSYGHPFLWYDILVKKWSLQRNGMTAIPKMILADKHGHLIFLCNGIRWPLFYQHEHNTEHVILQQQHCHS